MNKYLLIAEDDDDDRFLAKEALNSVNPNLVVKFVNDGNELMTFLTKEENYSSLPSLILLDLNMPKIDGRECLSLIKKNDLLKSIPVIVYTTSGLQEDIAIAYSSGVNSYIKKMVEFDDMKSLFKKINEYWFNIVKLPTA